MKKSTLKIALTSALTGLVLAVIPGAVQAQTLTTLGATQPTPGANDVSQFSATGNQTKPDGLNYYTDNGGGNNSPGQTFTTPSANSAGYVLTSVALKSGALDSGGGGTGIQTAGYRLQIYSIAGASATQIASYTMGAGTFSYTPGDWLQVSGLAISLNANSTYAYTFGRLTTGWDNLDVASGNPYAGGEICLIPSAGGAFTTGASHAFDAQFDIGLGLQGGAPVVGAPTATPNPCYALSPVVLSDSSSSATYQWQTNSDISGGLGGTWANIPGATSLTITNIPPDIGSAYTLDYQLVATSGALSTTSTPVALTVSQATAPVVSVDTTPAGPIITHAGATLTLTATFVGTTPITNQWQTDAGQTGTYTNIPGQTTGTLTITNLQVVNSGNYRLQASNIEGTTTSTPVQVSVLNVIWSENFNCPTTPDQPISNVGWRDDVIVPGSDTRIFTGNGGVNYSVNGNAVYSWPNGPEAFYATTATANGGPYAGGTITNKQPLPIINLANVQNLAFGADLNSTFNGNLTHAYIAVQLNFGQWYSATTELLPQGTSATFVTDTLPFSSDLSTWNLLTVSGTGSQNNPNYPAVGANAGPGQMTGYITGVGLVITHDGGATLQFDNYVILGTIPQTALPVISSPPSSVTNYTGTTATFSVTATTNGSSAGLSYQWQADTAVGSGIWGNLANGGQFSGVNSSQLTVAGVTALANDNDYRVIVTDGAGSVTSTPPATLTVIDSAPLLMSGTSIYPDAAPAFGTANAIYRVGNSNTVRITASFIGDLPMSFQWSVSPNADGSAAVNIPGATNSTLTLSNPQTNSSGYYTVTVSNSQSVTPTNSGLAQLTVLPADPTLIQWSAPVVINGLTAAQFLYGVPGTFIGAESFAAPAPITVTNGGTQFLFDNTGSVAASAGGRQILDGYIGPSTGDTNLDTVLNIDWEQNSSSITVNNLTPGQLYSVQLVALNDNAGNTRPVRWSDPDDASAADFSPAFIMGDNVYVVGTFVANNTTKTITYNQVVGGYLSCAIVRAGLPTMTMSRSGSNLRLDWNFGTLLESTNVAGPYTQTSGTTTGPSSYTTVPTGSAKFYRVSFP